MQVYEMFVDDKNYEKEDGYTLLYHDAYTLGIGVETAIKNGYDGIRISPADTLKKLEYIKKLQEQNPEIIIP